MLTHPYLDSFGIIYSIECYSNLAVTFLDTWSKLFSPWKHKINSCLSLNCFEGGRDWHKLCPYLEPANELAASPRLIPFTGRSICSLTLTVKESYPSEENELKYENDTEKLSLFCFLDVHCMAIMNLGPTRGERTLFLQFCINQ